MILRALPVIASLAVALAPLAPSLAGAACARDAMLVMDGSASMAEVGFDVTGPTRIIEARAALRQAMPGIAQMRRVGLLTYGPGGSDSCSGLSVVFAPRDGAAAAVIAGVEALTPGGLTPIAASVQAAADVLENDGIVVLVTDGHETCGGMPCTLGRDLARRAPNLTVHVIGFRVVHDPFVWDSPDAGLFTGEISVAKCLSDATGGIYVNTETIEELAAALDKTLGCAVIGLSQWREQVS